MTLKVFTNHVDTVVAKDLDDVAAVLANHYGSTMEEEGWSLDDWGEVADEKVITIRNFNDRGWDDKGTRTAAEWARTEGRGFLCSTEWFMWILHHAGELAHADGDEFTTAEAAEANARAYTDAKYRGVKFVTVHRVQVSKSSP